MRLHRRLILVFASVVGFGSSAPALAIFTTIDTKSSGYDGSGTIAFTHASPGGSPVFGGLCIMPTFTSLAVAFDQATPSAIYFSPPSIACAGRGCVDPIGNVSLDLVARPGGR